MIEVRASNNLPMEIVVNRTMVTPNKSKQAQMLYLILIPTMSGFGNHC